MRIAVLADIGQPAYHVGDEAIAHAAAEALLERGHIPVLLTRDEAHTRRYFGDVETIPSPVFPWPHPLRERRVAQVREAIDSRDPLTALRRAGFDDLIDALAGCDAVHVAGGGNLNSTYGWLLSERVAVGLIADALGKPLTLSGQTLGPTVTDADVDDLRDLFSRCAVLGFRDLASVDRATSLLRDSGRTAPVPVLDDATFLAASPPVTATGKGADHLAVTLSPDVLDPFRSPQEAAALLAALLDRVASSAGLDVVFVPHMARPGEGDGDEAVHALVASAMRTREVALLPIDDAAGARAALGSAALVVSSRFHPVVFAVAEGRPAVGLCATGYSFSRIQGVFENWGLSGFALPIDSILDPGVAGGIAALADDAAVRDHLRRCEPGHRRFATEWWDHLVGTMAGAGQDAPALVRPPTHEAPAPLLLAARRLRLFARRAQTAEAMKVDRDRAADRVAALEEELNALRARRVVRGSDRLGRLRGGLRRAGR